MSEIHDKVNEFNEAIKDLEVNKKEMISELQAKCNHPYEHILDFKSGMGDSHRPDRRFCRNCGLSEEINAAHKMLIKSPDEVPLISSNYSKRFVLLYINDSQKEILVAPMTYTKDKWVGLISTIGRPLWDKYVNRKPHSSDKNGKNLVYTDDWSW